MTSKEFKDRLTRRARRADALVSPELTDQFEAYFRLLARWNEKINLTALPISDPSDEAIDRLLIEPLVASRHFTPLQKHVIDLGSGGGSPAIPLKLALPVLSLRMVESKTRRSAFLSEAIRALELNNAIVETARFEELLSRPELHETADVATIRAVRVERRVLQTVQAFIKPGGLIFLFRSASGPDSLPGLEPPLAWAGSLPLVQDSIPSRLVLLRKNQVSKKRI